MTLWAMREVWEIKNGSDLFDSFVLNNMLDRAALIDYLMLEYGEMTTLDSDCNAYRRRIETFFKTHKWNIDKLTESMYFKYDPIHNTQWHQNHTWNRDETIDMHQNVDNDWTEDGQTDETDTNYVSAYNDVESREGNIVDTEHHRDVIDIDYHKEGTDDTITDRQDVEDEGYVGDIIENGHKNNHTFQQLIEEERAQAQFNIYKWIGKHFCLECCIAIW